MIEQEDQQQYAEDAAATRDLLNKVDFGLETNNFLNSRIGRYVANRALEDMYAVSQALPDADPFDHKAISALQLRHKIASAALSWLAQAVEAGHQAEQEYLARGA